MQKQRRLSSLVVIPFIVLMPLKTFAMSPHFSDGYGGRHYSGYEYDSYDYEDGYDDGYDDAMDDCPCPPLLLWRGFYAGAELGYDSYNINQSINEFFTSNLNSYSRGAMGNVLAGYGRDFQRNLYLGGEVFAGESDASNRLWVNSTGTYSSIFSARTSYGLSVKPGYKLQNGPTLYVDVGYMQTQFKHNEMVSGAMYSTSKWVSGVSYGLGAEARVNKNFRLRFEYDRIDYSHFDSDTTGTGNFPSNNQAKVGFIIPF